MDIKRLLEIELNDERIREGRYRAILSGLPRGTLTASQKNGRSYYKRSVDGNYKYIGDGCAELVRKLKLRKFLETSLSVINSNRKVLEDAIERYISADPYAIITSLPMAYRPEGQGCSGYTVAEDPCPWFDLSGDRDEGVIGSFLHETAGGDIVETRAEAMIADLLFSKGINYQYRTPLDFGVFRLYPSFTVNIRGSAEIRIIEHCGRASPTQDPSGIDAFLGRAGLYMRCGFVPFRDVFFTFEDEKGEPDMDALELIADRFIT